MTTRHATHFTIEEANNRCDQMRADGIKATIASVPGTLYRVVQYYDETTGHIEQVTREDEAAGDTGGWSGRRQGDGTMTEHVPTAQHITRHATETIATAQGDAPVAYAVETWDDGIYYVSWGILHDDGAYEAIDVVQDVCPTYDDAVCCVETWAHAV